MKIDFIKELKDRGLVHNYTPEIETLLTKEEVSGYIGFDATAPSLHVGNLGAIMLLKYFQMSGHKPYIIIGGGTTMVGDPGGKKHERKLLNLDVIRENLLSIKVQLAKFLDFSTGTNSAVILNNYDWLHKFSFLDFAREVGKHIPVSYMLGKESVKRRLETGLSFAEFSYQLLQGYDFLYLYNRYKVKLQMGGSDQWGNLTTGTELIRRKSNGEAHAITMPLITKSDGTKFGKTEEGAIWLDPNMTSPYKFYQFWLNCSDEDVMRFIKIFSLLPINEIHNLVEKHLKEPHLRLLQKTLAKEITIRIHSENAYNKAKKASNILFNKGSFFEEISAFEEDLMIQIFEGMPVVNLLKSHFVSIVNIIDFLVESTDKIICSSKGEARRAINAGSIYINKNKINEEFLLSDIKLIKDKFIIIQKGKKNHYLVIIE